MGIKNNTVYLERMSLGMEDKLFFLNHLSPQITTVLDFGCADAALGVALKQYRPDLTYVGYDNSIEMIDKAAAKMPSSIFIRGESSLKQYIEFGYLKPENTILVLSSVIHEVYSYAKSAHEIINFWKFVLNSGFKQVSVRDMALSSDDLVRPIPFYAEEVLGSYIVANYCQDFIPETFAAYYQGWLKYWYKENWERESRENYFPMSHENISQNFYLANYTQTHFETFRVPFIVEKIKKDFGFDPLLCDTHIKAIYELKTI